MTEAEKKMLAVFDVRVQDLIDLCDEQKSKIKTLTELMQQAKKDVQELKTKNADLLTAHIASLDEGDVKQARLRLLSLVREVDECIALLNE